MFLDLKLPTKTPPAKRKHCKNSDPEAFIRSAKDLKILHNQRWNKKSQAPVRKQNGCLREENNRSAGERHLSFGAAVWKQRCKEKHRKQTWINMVGLAALPEN